MYPSISLILKHSVCFETKINKFDFELNSKSYMLVGKREGKTKKKNLFVDIFVITNDYKHITKLYHPQTCMFS